MRKSGKLRALLATRGQPADVMLTISRVRDGQAPMRLSDLTVDQVSQY